MSLCNRSDVTKLIEGKSVAIVGGAPSVLINEEGFIDGHDIVVRVNNYKLFRPTGERTDIYYSYFGGAIKKTVKELIHDGVKLCMCKCPNTKFIESEWHRLNGKMNGVDFRYIYRMRKDWWFCKTYVPELEHFLKVFNTLGQHIPTTGFSAIYDILEHNPKSVYITGFDFFESKLHNVNEKWEKINTKDPIKHMPEFEKKWLKDNLNNYPITADEYLTRLLNA